MHERLSVDPSVFHGQVCIKGTRIPVHQVVGMLANGDTVEDLLEEYPSLEREDVFASIANYLSESGWRKTKLIPRAFSVDPRGHVWDTSKVGPE